MADDASEYQRLWGKPAPSLNHAIVQTRLAGAFVKAREFSILPELTLQFPDGTRLTPDIAVYPRLRMDWSRDRMPMTVMPRMAVIILCPSEGWQVVEEKRDLLFAHGVGSLWAIQPGIPAVAIFLPDASRPHVFSKGLALDPVTGLTADPETLFSP